MDLLFERCRDPDERVRAAAVEHIGYHEDERILPALLHAIRDEAPRVREAAAHSLANMHDPAALPVLRDMLSDRSQWVRTFAVRALGDQDCREALDVISRLATEDPAIPVRIAAIEALGRIGGQEKVGFLAEKARDEDQNVARAALLALGSIGGPDSLAIILSAIKTPDQATRVDAVKALQSHGGPRAVEALQAAAMDTDPLVSRAAAHALAGLDTEEAVYCLLQLTAEQRCREACLEALAKVGRQRVQWVARGLRHPEVRVRLAILEVLAGIKDPEATSHLLKSLHDPAEPVRMAALSWLNRIGSFQAGAIIAEVARSDPDARVRMAAVELLRTHSER
jgi:HEAT repeat protein